MIFEFTYTSEYGSFLHKGKVIYNPNNNSWDIEWHDHITPSSLKNVLYNLNRVSKKDYKKFKNKYPELLL